MTRITGLIVVVFYWGAVGNVVAEEPITKWNQGSATPPLIDLTSSNFSAANLSPAANAYSLPGPSATGSTGPGSMNLGITPGNALPGAVPSGFVSHTPTSFVALYDPLSSVTPGPGPTSSLKPVVKTKTLSRSTTSATSVGLFDGTPGSLPGGIGAPSLLRGNSGGIGASSIYAQPTTVPGMIPGVTR